MARTVWFPGHMAKGKRELDELRDKLDLIVEVRDARAPRLTASPLLDRLRAAGLMVWTVLSKSDIAAEATTRRWLSAIGRDAWAADIRKGVPAPLKKNLTLLKPHFREVRLAVVGVPNVGKSQLLNQLVGRRAAAVGGIPGVTKGVSWFKGNDLLVVDSPGILDPHADVRAGRMLTWLAATKGQVIGSWHNHAVECISFISKNKIMNEAWGVSLDTDPEEALEAVGRRLGKLLPGGVVDEDAAGKAFLDAFSTGKLGRISLESPGTPPPWEGLS